MSGIGIGAAVGVALSLLFSSINSCTLAYISLVVISGGDGVGLSASCGPPVKSRLTTNGVEVGGGTCFTASGFFPHPESNSGNGSIRATPIADRIIFIRLLIFDFILCFLSNLSCRGSRALNFDGLYIRQSVKQE